MLLCSVGPAVPWCQSWKWISRFVSLICHLKSGKCGTDAEINEDRFVKERRRSLSHTHTHTPQLWNHNFMWSSTTIDPVVRVGFVNMINYLIHYMPLFTPNFNALTYFKALLTVKEEKSFLAVVIHHWTMFSSHFYLQQHLSHYDLGYNILIALFTFLVLPRHSLCT